MLEKFHYVFVVSDLLFGATETFFIKHLLFHQGGQEALFLLKYIRKKE